MSDSNKNYLSYSKSDVDGSSRVEFFYKHMKLQTSILRIESLKKTNIYILWLILLQFVQHNLILCTGLQCV